MLWVRKRKKRLYVENYRLFEPRPSLEISPTPAALLVLLVFRLRAYKLLHYPANREGFDPGLIFPRKVDYRIMSDR